MKLVCLRGKIELLLLWQHTIIIIIIIIVIIVIYYYFEILGFLLSILVASFIVKSEYFNFIFINCSYHI